MRYTNGKWIPVNPSLNFTEDPKDHYSPEVWIVTDDHTKFDLPPELSQESTGYLLKWDSPEGVPVAGKDCVYLRDDVIDVWNSSQGDGTTTYVYTFADKTFEYVIHETVELDGEAYYAIIRVKHHSSESKNEELDMTEYLKQQPVINDEVIDNE
tara:strand:+ start:5643 stop:6104 length:462 start_codon:yes stop_codon:yes gene_type:complete